MEIMALSFKISRCATAISKGINPKTHNGVETLMSKKIKILARYSGLRNRQHTQVLVNNLVEKRMWTLTRI